MAPDRVPAQSRLAARYGRTRSRRPVVIALSALAVVFLAVVAYVGLRAADQPVRAESVAYEHVDASHVRLTFQVTMRPGTRAHCSVQAMDASRGQVGFTGVDVGPESASITDHTVTIATQGEAVSASVIGCEKA